MIFIFAFDPVMAVSADSEYRRPQYFKGGVPYGTITVTGSVFEYLSTFVFFSFITTAMQLTSQKVLSSVSSRPRRPMSTPPSLDIIATIPLPSAPLSHKHS